MTVPLFVPFINKPDVTGQIPVGLTTAYTVPSGKYARVTVMLSVTAGMSFSFQSGNAGLSIADNIDGARSETFSLWLKAGDVITISGTTAGSSSSVTYSASATYPVSASATITVNGNPYTIQCYGKIITGWSGASGTYNVTNISQSKSLIHYEEYIEPT